MIVATTSRRASSIIASRSMARNSRVGATRKMGGDGHHDHVSSWIKGRRGASRFPGISKRWHWQLYFWSAAECRWAEWVINLGLGLKHEQYWYAMLTHVQFSMLSLYFALDFFQSKSMTLGINHAVAIVPRKNIIVHRFNLTNYGMIATNTNRRSLNHRTTQH